MSWYRNDQASSNRWGGHSRRHSNGVFIFKMYGTVSQQLHCGWGEGYSNHRGSWAGIIISSRQRTWDFYSLFWTYWTKISSVFFIAVPLDPYLQIKVASINSHDTMKGQCTQLSSRLSRWIHLYSSSISKYFASLLFVNYKPNKNWSSISKANSSILYQCEPRFVIH